MLRRVLERQGAAAEAALSDSQSTPLRSHWSGLNPTRLIDKQMTSASRIQISAATGPLRPKSTLVKF
ncbi:hypothetical protein PV325_012641 [Microctonus aethiopoides]|nr:hypothetical protein PV325_012641 [Microctonus aethiopoides]KAK0096479.1 hypothetical protein PV326_005373 [Microctonus aethiopoides]